MKKLLTVFFAVLVSAVLLAVPVSAATSIIDDMAGLYTESQLEELKKKQQEVSDLTGWNIAVVTSNVGLGENGTNAMRFAEDYYDENFGSESSSVVYLIDLDYRHFAMDGDVLDYFNGTRLDRMIDDCEKKYFNYDDVGNLEKFYYHLEKNYNAGTVARDPDIGRKGEDFVPSDGVITVNGYDVTMLLGGMIMGGIAAAIGIAIVLSRYKLHHVPTANCYLNGNNINFYRREDRFVREYTTRTRIDSGSSGGGGGGGGHSHGGSHHGGGGHGGRR